MLTQATADLPVNLRKVPRSTHVYINTVIQHSGSTHKIQLKLTEFLCPSCFYKNMGFNLQRSLLREWKYQSPVLSYGANACQNFCVLGTSGCHRHVPVCMFERKQAQTSPFHQRDVKSTTSPLHSSSAF